MTYTAAFLVFISIINLGLYAGMRKGRGKVDLAGRLGQVDTKDPPVDARREELRTSLWDRLVMGPLKKIAGRLSRFLPGGMLQEVEGKLQKAGNPGNLTAGEFMGLRVILAGLGGLAAPLLVKQAALLALAAPLLGWSLPAVYLDRQARKREEEIYRTLPDVIDLLTVSVEAGLGFEGAISKVVEKSRGVLAGEFKRVLQESRMGKSRKEALKDMSRRLGEENVAALNSAIVQADQLGISFSKVLRLQSDQVRQKRRQQVEEAAMKAPIKMLLPLVLFIFPTIFIVLLGPAAIRIYENFM